MDLQFRSFILQRAESVSREIEYTLAAFDPSFTTDILPPREEDLPPTIDDCQFEDCIEDPFEVIRHVKGEEAAKWLEYEGDLEVILSEIQECSAILLSRGERTTTVSEAAKEEGDVQGNPEGTEPHNCEGVA